MLLFKNGGYELTMQKGGLHATHITGSTIMLIMVDKDKPDLIEDYKPQPGAKMFYIGDMQVIAKQDNIEINTNGEMILIPVRI